jgi:hypothetical protein
MSSRTPDETAASMEKQSLHFTVFRRCIENRHDCSKGLSFCNKVKK